MLLLAPNSSLSDGGHCRATSPSDQAVLSGAPPASLGSTLSHEMRRQASSLLCPCASWGPKEQGVENSVPEDPCSREAGGDAVRSWQMSSADSADDCLETEMACLEPLQH